jgi:hypothetical protein
MKIQQNSARISEKHLETALAYIARNMKAQMPDTEAEVITMFLSLSPVALTEEQIGKFEQTLQREIHGPKQDYQQMRKGLEVKSKTEFKRRLRQNAANSFTVADLSQIVDGISLKHGEIIRPVAVQDKLHGSVIKFEIIPSKDLIYLKADEVFEILKINGRVVLT